jgi:hypothetical protein
MVAAGFSRWLLVRVADDHDRAGGVVDAVLADRAEQHPREDVEMAGVAQSLEAWPVGTGWPCAVRWMAGRVETKGKGSSSRPPRRALE